TAGRMHDDRFDAVQVAFDGAVDRDHARMNVALYDTVGADGDALRVIDRAFESALQDEVFVGAQLTLEAQRGSEDGHLAIGRRRGRRLARRRRCHGRNARTDRGCFGGGGLGTLRVETKITHDRSPSHLSCLDARFFSPMSMDPLKWDPSTRQTDGAAMLP